MGTVEIPLYETPPDPKRLAAAYLGDCHQDCDYYAQGQCDPKAGPVRTPTRSGSNSASVVTHIRIVCEMAGQPKCQWGGDEEQVDEEYEL